MKITMRLAVLGGIALGVAALGSACASASASAVHDSAGLVFVQTDNPSGNTVLAYRRAVDGSLDPAGSYPTGGLGGVLAGSVVDHLASEGSLALNRRRGLLYAVNAGSNTITVFAVQGDHLTRLQVISSGGTFPVSVTFGGNLVYVLNGRGGGSIQGYRLVPGHDVAQHGRLGPRLALIPAWHRSLGLDTAATPEFTHTPGEIAFTPDGSKIVVTTKAGGNSIEVFPVGRGGQPARPVVNAEPGAVPFGATFDAQGHLAITEAGPNAVVAFAIHGDDTVAPVSRAATGQAGTCWISGTGTLLYTSNAGSASLSGYQDRLRVLSPLGRTSTDAGTVDSAISPDGRFLYAQTGGNGIVDEFRIGPGGSLSVIGSVTVPGSGGGEGIAAS